MSVRPHPTKGNGWWIIDFYPSGRKGKRVRLPFKGTKGEALAIEQEHRRAPGTVVNKIAPLIKDLIAPWLEYYETEVRPQTYKDAVNSLAHWLPHFGAMKPGQLSKAAINTYKQAMLRTVANKKAVQAGKPAAYMSKRTINKTLSYLSSFLRWAAENDHCDEIHFRITGFPARQTKPEIKRPLTPRQISLLYDCTDEQYKLIFLLMADMGLRRSEALFLKAEDVDEYHETINVTGKGGRQRSIPFLSDRFANELLKALDVRQTGYLSVSPKTGKPFNAARKWLLRAAKKAGIDQHIHPHLLRHSCLSNLAMKGMSPHALQQIAGHANIETTNKIYVHIRHDFVSEEARKIREGA